MDTFTIYPAIDLRDGKVVRLAQGDPNRKTVYSDDPVKTALRWKAAGASWLHIVNLDGAFNEDDQKNKRAIAKIASCVPEMKIQVGGGIRSNLQIEEMLGLGCKRVIIGTAAVKDPILVSQITSQFGHEKVIVGIDSRDNHVRIAGWKESSKFDPISLGKKMARSGIRKVILTNILRDGMGTGIDLELTRNFASATDLDVIASGGVVNLNDVRAVKELGVIGVVIGKALYEGKITLEEALAC